MSEADRKRKKKKQMKNYNYKIKKLLNHLINCLEELENVCFNT